MARMRSPIGVPPGSFVTSADGSCPASRRSCVVFPEPSIPSNVMNTAARILTACSSPGGGEAASLRTLPLRRDGAEQFLDGVDHLRAVLLEREGEDAVRGELHVGIASDQLQQLVRV